MQLRSSRPRVLQELADAEPALRNALASLGVERALIHGRARGGTSVCYFISAEPGRRRYLLKCPTPGENLAEEYRALERAAGATGLAMRLPKPAAWLSSEAG